MTKMRKSRSGRKIVHSRSDLTPYPDDEPVDIGRVLVDEHGRKIMRSERAPIGFVHFD
jgi:hypothetical protein